MSRNEAVVWCVVCICTLCVLLQWISMRPDFMRACHVACEPMGVRDLSFPPDSLPAKEMVCRCNLPGSQVNAPAVPGDDDSVEVN